MGAAAAERAGGARAGRVVPPLLQTGGAALCSALLCCFPCVLALPRCLCELCFLPSACLRSEVVRGLLREPVGRLCLAPGQTRLAARVHSAAVAVARARLLTTAAVLSRPRSYRLTPPPTATRAQVEAQVVAPLFRGVALALSTHLGALVPLGSGSPRDQPSLIRRALARGVERVVAAQRMRACCAGEVAAAFVLVGGKGLQGKIGRAWSRACS